MLGGFMFKWLVKKMEKWTEEHDVPESAFIKPGVRFNYLINDPTTPNLKKKVLIPNTPNKMRLLVHGMNSTKDKIKEGSPEELATNCYVTLVNSLQSMQNILKQFNHIPSKWAACERLSVFPCAGKDFNAYYNRKALKFFYDKDPVTRKQVYTANSSDIVAHELGHAILDTIRPDFWDVQALEIWAFHEAFADINAMWHIMQYDETLNMMIKETNGDISKPNIATRLAEEMGNAIYHLTNGQYGYTLGALRDATNNFKYTIPEKLPKEAPDNKLAAECHSFGRVFMGAWYQMFCNIYDKEVKNGNSKLQAIKIARNISYEYLLRSVYVAPRTVRYHDAIARVILSEDKKKGSPYQDIIRNVFTKRNLLLNRVHALSRKTWDDVKSVLKPEDIVVQKKDRILVSIKNNKFIKISDYESSELSMLSVNGIDLHKTEIEVAADSYYEFNNEGVMQDEILSSEDEFVDAAKACLLSIQSAGNIGPNPELMWEVQDGKLKRTLIE
jgi:hypothetical protein